MFWENEMHILQGPHRPNSAIWEPVASQGTKRLNPFQGKPRTQCYLDRFPIPEFNYCPGRPGNQLLVKFCIPRAQGILIILKGKIKRFVFKMQISLAELLRPRVFGVTVSQCPLNPPLSFSHGFLFLEACSLDCFDWAQFGEPDSQRTLRHVLW